MTYRLDGREKSNFIIRIKNTEGKKIEIHTRKIKWNDDVRSYDYGINTKCQTIDDAFDLMEECAINLSHCGKARKSIFSLHSH